MSLLGPVEAVARGEPLPLGGPRRRALLAALALRANETVSRDGLVDALWGEEPPEPASNALQVAVHELRKRLGAARIERVGSGYRLRLAPGELDLATFTELCERAAEADPADAAALLREALALWRGVPLAGVGEARFAAAEADRLEALRLAALERRVEADLALGRHADLVPELEALVREHPYREPLRRQLMLALYGAGRQAGALEAYRQARSLFVAELGMEPSRALRELERAILRQDPALEVAGPVARPPSNVPAPARRLIGRGLELAAVTALVRDPEARLVTLTGPGGTGKTRLALEVVRTLRDDVAGGVYLADLAPLRDPALVAPTAARALGMQDQGDGPLLERLASSLGDREVLLLVDNFEHVLAAAPFVGDLLARAPSLRVLATSRAPLRIAAEHEYRVPPLELPARDAGGALEPVSRTAAVALFVERARAARPGFELTAANAGAVVDVCHALDGLPLALELAAARVKLLSPAALLRRLEDRLGVLADGDRDLPDRQRTLRATVDWSYDLLEPSEQILLARLSVFAGGWTLEAAEAVCAADLTSLGSLVEKSLLRVRESDDGEPRFSMLETVREYALERLDARGDLDGTRARHAEYYAALAERLEPQLYTPLPLDEVEREHDNFRAALAFAHGAGDVELGLRLVAVARFWYVRGFQREGSAWLEQALAREGGSPARRAVALGWAAGLAWTRGDYDAAIERAAESLPRAREAGDGLAAIRALTILGLAHGSSDDLQRAKRFHTESLELSRALGRERDVGIALANLAGNAISSGDYEAARALATEGLALNRRLGFDQGTAAALMSLAVSGIELGEREEAVPMILESLRLYRDLDFKDYMASTLVALATAVADRDPIFAARLLGASSTLRSTLGPPSWWWEGIWFERVLERVRHSLGVDAAAAARDQGAGAPEATIGEALASTR